MSVMKSKWNRLEKKRVENLAATVVSTTVKLTGKAYSHTETHAETEEPFGPIEDDLSSLGDITSVDEAVATAAAVDSLPSLQSPEEESTSESVPAVTAAAAAVAESRKRRRKDENEITAATESEPAVTDPLTGVEEASNGELPPTTEQQQQHVTIPLTKHELICAPNVTDALTLQIELERVRTQRARLEHATVMLNYVAEVRRSLVSGGLLLTAKNKENVEQFDEILNKSWAKTYTMAHDTAAGILN